MYRAVVWDFDGVVNRSVENGSFLWAENFEEDIGESLEVFEKFLFGRDFGPVITGSEDVLERIEDWANQVNFDGDIFAILEYWFKKDTKLDPKILKVMEWVSQEGAMQAIATNTDARRAKFIKNNTDFGIRLTEIFASGNIKISKPSTNFFEYVTKNLDVQPEEVIFFDDSEKNILAAQQYGWKAVFYCDQSFDELCTLIRT